MSELRLVVDTDPGLDDALALILAHHFADVVGITAVAGNTRLENAKNNALRICELLDSQAPVHAGSARPLTAAASFADEVHGSDGLGGIDLPAPTRSLASENAVEYLLDVASKDLWVVALGPLTNIAKALQTDSEWLTRLAGFAFMGGAAYGGNVTPSAEFNIYFDPEAADVVFSASGSKQMLGLNLTHQVQVSSSEVQQVASSTQLNTISSFATETFNQLIARLLRLTGTDEVAMHDPCAILAVTHPQFFKFKPRPVAIELNGELTRGRTVVDERPRVDPASHNVDVGYEADATAVKELIFSTIYGK